MRKNFIIYYLFLLFLFLVSCDYVTGLEGKIIDKETGKPIVGATVNLADGKDIQETNADGFFSVSYRPSHLTPPKILVTKKGYKPFQLEMDHSDNDRIYKVTSETKYVKLSEPFFFVPNDTKTYMVNMGLDKWSCDFAVSDTLRIYLTIDNEKLEIEKEKAKIRKDWETENRVGKGESHP